MRGFYAEKKFDDYFRELRSRHENTEEFMADVLHEHGMNVFYQTFLAKLRYAPGAGDFAWWQNQVNVTTNQLQGAQTNYTFFLNNLSGPIGGVR